MKQLLKLSVAFCILITVVYTFAGDSSKSPQINPNINTVALAKKETSTDNFVLLTGTLVKTGKKIFLQDSTGKITLEAPKKTLKSIAPMINQHVRVTGNISNILWKNTIKVQSIEVDQTSNTFTDVGLKK